MAATANCAEGFDAGRAIDVKRLSEVRFSSDGSQLVCVIADPRESGGVSHLWALHVGKGELQRLTTSSGSERLPKWAPGRKALAFLSDGGGVAQVVVLSKAGGEVRAVTTAAHGVSDFAWSPDGKQIAYLAREGTSRDDTSRDGASSKVAGHDEWVADRAQDLERLFVVDVASMKVRPLSSVEWRFLEFDWSTQARIIAIASAHPASFGLTNALYAITVADGRTTLIAKPKLPFRGLSLSPDRQQLAYVASATGGPIAHDLFLQPASGGAGRDVTAALDRAVFDARWQNRSVVIVRVADGFRNRLFRVAAADVSKAGVLAAGVMAIDVPQSLSAETAAFDVAADGAIAFVGGGFDRLPELYIRKSNGAVVQVSHVQEGWDGIRLADAQTFHFKSFDGGEVEAALMRPNDGAAEKLPSPSPSPSPLPLPLPLPSPLPLVLVVHDGPADHFSAGYAEAGAWSQLLTANGYQVLLVNPRGSTGYGEKFVKANRGDLGGGDYRDLIFAVDAVIDRGDAAAGEVAVTGWGYGGQMAAWAITQGTRFKTAVSGAGVFDLAAHFAALEQQDVDEWYLGVPWEQPDVFARASPATFVRNAKTPTLVLHGAADDVTSVAQSQALYRALKRYGVDTQLVVYPGEGHVPRQMLRPHQIDMAQRTLDWLDHHLKN